MSPSIGVTPGGVSPLLWDMVRRQYVEALQQPRWGYTLHR